MGAKVKIFQYINTIFGVLYVFQNMLGSILLILKQLCKINYAIVVYQTKHVINYYLPKTKYPRYLL